MVFPLSFAEFYDAYEGEKRDAWQDYYTYGGMPVVLSLNTHEKKSRYLRDLFERTYIKDVIERHKVKNDEEVLERLLDVLAAPYLCAVSSSTIPSGKAFLLSNSIATIIRDLILRPRKNMKKPQAHRPAASSPYNTVFHASRKSSAHIIAKCR